MVRRPGKPQNINAVFDGGTVLSFSPFYHAFDIMPGTIRTIEQLTGVDKTGKGEPAATDWSNSRSVPAMQYQKRQ